MSERSDAFIAAVQVRCNLLLADGGFDAMTKFLKPYRVPPGATVREVADFIIETILSASEDQKQTKPTADDVAPKDI